MFFTRYIVKIARAIEKKGHSYYARSQVNKALYAWRIARIIRDFFIWLLGYNTRIFVLNGNGWGCAIGHIASIDYITRLHKLGLLPFDEIHYYQDARFIANEYLLQQYSDEIIFHSFETYQKNQDFVDLAVFSLTILPFKSKFVYYQKLFAISENIVQNTAANITTRKLPQCDIDDGYKALAKIGLVRDDWFVTLHIRGDDYYQRRNMVNQNNPSARNGNIDDYIKAIETILAHGGQVVLLGDKDTHIPPSLQNRIIDYAHSDIICDKLDIFLCAENLFFFGSASGISHVPSIFGKSALFANLMPYHGRPIRKGDFWLAKKIYDEKQQRLLTMKDGFANDILTLHDTNALAKYGLRVINNNADELNDAILDMLSYHQVIDTPFITQDQSVIDKYDHVMCNKYYGQCVPSAYNKL